VEEGRGKELCDLERENEIQDLQCKLDDTEFKVWDIYVK
jgi:hypothetical protein